MIKESGIYKIQSKIKPERIYIGSAINLNNRKRTHFSALRRNKHYSKKLQSHYNKYGDNDLVFSVLLTCAKEDLIKHEQFFIDAYNPWFNCSKTAGSPLGVKHSKEECKRRSEFLKGKNTWTKGRVPWNKGKKGLQVSWRKGHHGEYCGEKNPFWGKRHSEETKEKNRLWHTGRKQTNVTINKRIKKIKGQKRPPESRQNMSNAQKLRYLKEKLKIVA